MSILSPTALRELDERGFAFTDVLFDDATLGPLRDECRRVWIEYVKSLEGGGRPIPADDIRRLRPFLPRMFEQSAVVARFARHPAFIALARELIGDDADLAWSQACWKEPDADERTTFPYHQDTYFAEVDNGERGYACFVALAPLDVRNGTLHFAAGAHRTSLPHVRSDKHHWFECSVAGFEVVPGVLAPGQMVLYRARTPHGSPPNLSSAPREAMLMSFGPPNTRRVDDGELHGDQLAILRGGQVVER